MTSPTLPDALDAPTPLVVVGGGGHARAVLDAALVQPWRWEVQGFVDRQPCPATRDLLGVRQLGDDEDALARAVADPRTHFVLAVGNVGVSPLRRQIVARYGDVPWATIVHPAATVSPRARLGAGTVVLAGSIINAGSSVGAHAIVNTGAILEHDVSLGDFVHVGPGAVIGGASRIEAGSFLGLGCRVRDHVRIGADASIAMGAVVVTDVAAADRVRGVPARRYTAEDTSA